MQLLGIPSFLRNFSSMMLAIALSASSSFAAAPNDLVIVTDALDDDIRAIVHLLMDENSRPRVRGIVTSTGNTHLKAGVMRKIVGGLGLEAPVFAGTATDLRSNITTEFAGNVEKEGGPLLSSSERAYYDSIKIQSGDGVKKLTELIIEASKQNKKLDVLLLTAPIDLMPAIQANPRMASGVLGDLFTMGLWKKIDNAAGSASPYTLVTPYNVMADPLSSLALLRLVRGGKIFKRVFHVPTDTVQRRAGLPGGYIADDEVGLRYRAELRSAMQSHPVLRDVFSAAQEYGLSWIDVATRRFGMGLNDHDRWVPGSFKDPNQAAGFYLADMAPTLLAMMSEADIAKVPTENRFMTGMGSVDTRQPVQKPFTLFEEANTAGVTPILDVQSVNGADAIRTHLENARSASSKYPPKAGYMESEAAAKTYRGPEFSGNADDSHSNDGLVIVFKNSPDDWFGLLRILGTERGRKALQRGGIIAEGFSSQELANNLSAVLHDLGAAGITVAQGYSYSADEVTKIPNLGLESAFQSNGLVSKAFSALARTEVAFPSAAELLRRAEDLARKDNAKVDAILLGEGVDFVRYFKEGSLDVLGSLHVMGGGRVVTKGAQVEFNFTRNWLPHEEEVVSGLDRIGRAGKSVWIYSSDEFGGSLTSGTEEKVGNAEVAFNRLTALAKIPSLKAISEHWVNWAKNASWFFGARKAGTPFDANAPVAKVTISPLGLVIADEWERGDLESGFSPLRYDPIDLSETRKTKSLTLSSASTGLRWLRGEGHNNIVALSSRFSQILDKIETSHQAAAHHEKIRKVGLTGVGCENPLKD